MIRTLIAGMALVVGLASAPAVQAQVVIPTWNGGYQFYPPPYFWNNWNGAGLFNPYGYGYGMQSPPVVNNIALPVERDRRPPPQEEQPPQKEIAPSLPALPLSAPTYVVRWTAVGRFPILGFTVGKDGPTAVTLDVNGRRETVRPGDVFTAGDLTYRVTGIAPDAVNLVVQQQFTLR